MTGDPASDLRGLVALLALLLWPGLVVVRSPGPVVPFLSLSFWLLSWWWVPSGRERSSFLGAALLFFLLLSLLRLLKPLPVSRPEGRTLGVFVLALSCLLPLLWLPVAPGLSLASAEARLVAWREGLPATYGPLLPVSGFGAHAPGLPLLAADVALLSGVAPHRTVLLVALAACGLVVLAVFTLLARAGRPGFGLALAAALALATLLGAHGGFALPGPATLAAALGLVALGLLVRGSGRSPAVAAGALLGAAVTVHALAVLPIATAAAVVGSRRRRLLALAIGLVLSEPRLGLTLRATSPAEIRLAPSSELHELLPRREAVPDAGALLAMAWVRDHADPLARVCVSPGTAGRWLPAVAGRSVVPPEVPWVYRDEVRPGATSCRFAILFGPFAPAESPLDPARPPFAPAPWRTVFDAGSARVLAPASAEDPVTSFDTREGNPSAPRP